MTKKTVLITGASSGIGKATAETLSKSGYRLILVARRIEILEDLIKLLDTETYIAKVDVRNRKEVEMFFKKLPDNFKDIDVLLNNAGLARGLDAAPDAKIEDWEEMIDTNIKGLLYFTKEVLKNMKLKNSGQIINIGSVAGNVAYKGGNVYGATKAFVKHFSKNLRADLFGTDIKVTNIEPGIVETNFSVIRFNGDIKKAKAVYENTRALTPFNIADTIKWILDQPINVNIDNIEIMPIDQTFNGLIVNRK